MNNLFGVILKAEVAKVTGSAMLSYHLKIVPDFMKYNAANWENRAILPDYYDKYGSIQTSGSKIHLHHTTHRCDGLGFNYSCDAKTDRRAETYSF